MDWGKVIRRGLITWVVTTLSILFLSWLMKSFSVDGAGSAVIMAAIFGLLNSLVWPVLIRLALPLTVLTLGLGVLILNGLVVIAASSIESGSIVVEGLFSAVLVAFGITLVNTILLGALAIEDDEFFYLNVVKRRLAKTKHLKANIKPGQRGVFYLEIDGLAHDVLLRAITDGNAPNMSRWLRDGSHQLIEWETDWSSQTGAMQAGILHGNNKDIPAFRWWDKAKQRSYVSNRPKDAMEIEAMHSNGKGLLSRDGASRANLLSGDAPHSLLTMSTVLRKDRKGRIGQDYYTFFANPYNLLRTIMLTFQEVFLELWQARQQRILDVVPRVHRGLIYSLLRAWTTTVQRDLQVQAIIGDLLAGRPAAYTTFLGYDEVAHHSGIERIDSLLVLRKIDKQFRRIESVLKLAPMPYDLVILSDHGQTQGATFLQRYGVSLEQLITDLTETTITAAGHGDESASSLSTSLTEISEGEGFISRTVRGLREKDKNGNDNGPTADTIVMASGCLGLVYFNQIKRRASLEEIEKLHPKLIKNLRAHPGIGFILVNSKQNGPVVLGKSGEYYLKTGKINGKNPLKNFGHNAAKHIARTSSFKNCADIMINSTFWRTPGEVAAFEELVGSHGGMGGTQSYPFILYPSDWDAPKEPIVGAENVHKQLVKWLPS